MKDRLELIDDFNKADKPEWVKTPHIAVMNVIMSLELPSRLSQENIGKRAGCCQKEVGRIISDLRDKKWITVKSGARHQSTSWLTEVLYENLPTFVPQPKLIISAAASAIAEEYKKTFESTYSNYTNSRGHRVHKELPKDWKKRWPAILQLRMNQGWTVKEIVDRLKSCDSNPAWYKVLRVGPQNRKLFPAKKVTL